jgi:hypothetical protein
MPGLGFVRPVSGIILAQTGALVDGSARVEQQEATS